MESVYLNRNPTAKAILELVRSVDGYQICYDHFAFRTFGVFFFFSFCVSVTTMFLWLKQFCFQLLVLFHRLTFFPSVLLIGTNRWMVMELTQLLAFSWTMATLQEKSWGFLQRNWKHCGFLLLVFPFLRMAAVSVDHCRGYSYQSFLLIKWVQKLRYILS